MQTHQGLESDRTAQFLASRIDYERALAMPYGNRDFRLDRMRDLLARLGNPQDALRIVHVAGTKGKGSTAAMMAAALSAAGYRTGLYSSPHLERVEERLMIDGAVCPSDELATLVGRIRPVAAAMDALDAGDDHAGNRPTYFEITTALAILRFALHRVDAAVLEVGMGGRLDSTNVCRPLVSVITSISHDHTQQLGNTLAEIAREKAGIIKPGVPVVSGAVGEEARAVIAETARRHECRLVELGPDFDFDYRPPRDPHLHAGLAQMDFTYRADTLPQSVDGLELALIGRHQAANAAVGMAALVELGRAGFDVSDAALRRGLAQVRWPARIELLRKAPAVVLDSAHNGASVEALVRVLDESFSSPRRLLVFATTRDKNAGEMLSVLLPRFDEVIFTRYWSNPRGVPPEELERVAAELSPARRHVCPDPATAWRLAQRLAAPEHLICIAGSLFLAAEMRAVIGGPSSRGL
jgi:dihydrofolate synthase/folylpolyglutamate synthase